MGSKGSAHKGVEGFAKHLVGHPGGAKGDAAHVSIRVLEGRPGCPCPTRTAPVSLIKAANDRVSTAFQCVCYGGRSVGAVV